MTKQANTHRELSVPELTSSELDYVGGGAAPGQGHDPVPPPGTPAQPINPVAIVTAEVAAISAVPAALPGLL